MGTWRAVTIVKCDIETRPTVKRPVLEDHVAFDPPALESQ